MKRLLAAICFLCSARLAPEPLPDPAFLLGKARAAAMSGDHKEATSLYRLARKIYQKTDDSAGMGTVDIHLSDLALYGQEIEDAVRYRKNAYGLFQKAGKGFSQALALRELGFLTCLSGNAAKAPDMVEHAIRMFEFLKAWDEVHRTRAVLLLILSADRDFNPAQSIRECRTLLNAKNPNPSPEAVAQAYHYLGQAYWSLGDWETSVACYEQAISYREKYSLSEELQEILEANRAVPLMYLGRYHEAAGVHARLAQKRAARGNMPRALMNNINASVAFRYDGELVLSEKHLKAAEKIAKSCVVYSGRYRE